MTLDKVCFTCRWLRTAFHKDGAVAYVCGKVQLELADLIMGAEPCKDYEPAPAPPPSKN